MTDLFEPLRIGPMEVSNRICMPAMHLALARDYEVSTPLCDFYAARAAGGVGMIVAGYATVDEDSGNPGNIGAHDDRFVPGLARLAGVLRAGGARAALQLNHAGRYNSSFLLAGRTPVAPSAVASRLTRETPRALTHEEIETLVRRFGEAARRAREAGFDAVEVLTGTGYLVSQFLGPGTNLRSDRWGGSLEARARFGLAVIRTVREAAGPGVALLARTNGDAFTPEGPSREDLLRWAGFLVDAGVDAISVNVGWHEARVPQVVPEVPAGAFAWLARSIREATGLPVIAGHRIDDPQVARRLIREGACDGVAMGRALIADPDLPRKALEGREAEILHCTACGQGCLDNVFRLQGVECLANPRAGHEGQRVLRATHTPRRLLVVGGGPAGLAAARAAAECGHDVTLHERGVRLGGQLRLAGAVPGRRTFDRLADDLTVAAERAGVRLVTGSPVDRIVLETESPQYVVLATGARPATLDLPGKGPPVVQAWEVLEGRAQVGRRAVVVGGNAVGIETALYLAEEGSLPAEVLKFLLLHGAGDPEDLVRLAARGTRAVTVVERAGRMGKDFGPTTRWTLMQDVERAQVRLRTTMRAVALHPRGLEVEGPAGSEVVPADTVVLAVGAVSVADLAADLEALGIPFTTVGDAARVSNAFAAIHAGWKAGAEDGL